MLSLRAALGLCCLTITASLATAQELRVYTTTSDLSALHESRGKSSPPPPVLSRSLTLFHAGKVYNIVSESGEVIVYEPVQRRFTLLQVNAGTAAEVTQDQVRRYLSLAEEKVREHALELARQPGSTPEGALQLLEFQLHPDFEVKSVEGTGQFSLASPRCRYEVEGVKPPEPAVAEAYLKYADALAELNAVLNPHSLLPGPRLKVNQELRERQLLPILVRRQVDTDRTVDLRVRHEWTWRLLEHDRQMISHWEAKLARSDLRRIPFEQLQREVLSGKLTQR